MPKTTAERVREFRERHADRILEDRQRQRQHRAFLRSLAGRVSIHIEPAESGVLIRWDTDTDTRRELTVYADTNGLTLAAFMALFDAEMVRNAGKLALAQGVTRGGRQEKPPDLT